MYNYYKVREAGMTHYYRVSINSNPDTINDVRGIKCLHVNLTSACINEGYFIPNKKDYEIVEEKEFNESVEKVMDNLGINLKKFTFV